MQNLILTAYSEVPHRSHMTPFLMVQGRNLMTNQFRNVRSRGSKQRD